MTEVLPEHTNDDRPMTEEEADRIYEAMKVWAEDFVRESPGAENVPETDIQHAVDLGRFCFVYDKRDGVSVQVEMYKNAVWIVDRDTNQVIVHLLLSWSSPGMVLADNPTRISDDLLETLTVRWRWIALTAATLRTKLPDWARATEFSPVLVEGYEDMYRFFVTDNPNLAPEERARYDRVPDDDFR